MKKVIPVFKKDTFFSSSDGTSKAYRHDPELFQLLGSAKIIKLHWIGHGKSKSEAEITISAYESSFPQRRPSEVGFPIELSDATFTALRPDPITIGDPFQGRVEITIDIRDGARDGRSEVSVDGEMWATLIFEE